MEQSISPDGVLRIAENIQTALTFASGFPSHDFDQPRDGSCAWTEVKNAGGTAQDESEPVMNLYGAYSLGSAIWLPAAGECLRGLRQLYQKPMALYAFQSVARSVIELSARAWWMLDPQVDASTRTARYFVSQLTSIKRQDQVGAFGVGSNSAYGLRLHAFLEQARRAGLEVNSGKGTAPITTSEPFIGDTSLLKTPSGFNGVREPKGGDLVEEFISAIGSSHGRQWWAQLSGISHGTTYALIQHLVFEPNDKSDVLSTRLSLSTTTAMRTAYVATDAYLGAIETYAKLFGFESEEVAAQRLRLLREMTSIR
jgi:hypothetical protein